MRKIKELKNKLTLTVIYICIIALFWHLGITCLFKYFFNIECIGCGMTRAVVSALKCDFKAAFAYHPMFWAMPLLYAYFLFDGKVIGKKIPDFIVMGLIFLGLIVNWLVKIV